ncbi:MAG: GreA/GreB family elongation factor [Planctomycetota bacterium]
MTTTTSMSLASLVRAEDWNAVEKHWADLMQSGAPVDEVLSAIDVARETKHVSRVLPFVREHAELLETGERYADAAAMLGQTLLAGGPPGELSLRLFRCARAAHEADPWWDAYTTLAGFDESAEDVRKAWKAFHQLMNLGEGSTVFHRSGWGPGQVVEMDRGKLEVKIKFASGRRDWFPIKSVIETCDVLDSDDLRSLVVKDPDELARIIREEPLEVLTRVLRRYNGRTTQAVLKTAMAQLGLDGTGFTSWWRKARKVAEQSAMHEVTGSGAQTQIRLHDNEVDPVESMRRQLRMSKDLAAALARVRDLLADKNLGDDLKTAALETLEELAEQKDVSSAHRLSAWMLLRSVRGETPALLAARLQRAVDEGPPSQGDSPALWELFAHLPTARDQEACVAVLKEIYGDEWIDHACEHLLHAPPGMVRTLVEELLTNERGEVLSLAYRDLLLRPTRNPHLFNALAEAAESGRVTGDFPPPVQRLHSMLTLAHHLATGEGADPTRQRAQAKLSQILCSGAEPLMARLLADASRRDIKNLMPLIAKGVDGLLDRTFTHVAIARFPNIYRDENRPFWEEENVIWTTQAGLTRREEELRDLMENKIPANSEAIGKAASYGDLSENSEWEAAMEEQRNLTSRAKEIEDEVRRARLIEHAAIPEGIVAPGNRVSYRDTTSGEERTVAILGPWDTASEDTISYRSPVAQGMLGMRVGDSPTLKLPTGQAQVKILAVEHVALD